MLRNAEAADAFCNSEYFQVITSLASSTYSRVRVLARYFDFKFHNALERIVVVVFASTFTSSHPPTLSRHSRGLFLLLSRLSTCINVSLLPLRQKVELCNGCKRFTRLPPRDFIFSAAPSVHAGENIIFPGHPFALCHFRSRRTTQSPPFDRL